MNQGNQWKGSSLRWVLLIDDNGIDLLIHDRMLRAGDPRLRVNAFQSGMAALHFLEKCAERGDFPDLMLVDVNMPLMDGFGFIRACQEQPWWRAAGIQVFMLSSSGCDRDREEARRLGVQGYLVKPLATSMMPDLIMRAASC